MSGKMWFGLFVVLAAVYAVHSMIFRYPSSIVMVQGDRRLPQPVRSSGSALGGPQLPNLTPAQSALVANRPLRIAIHSNTLPLSYLALNQESSNDNSPLVVTNSQAEASVFQLTPKGVRPFSNYHSQQAKAATS